MSCCPGTTPAPRDPGTAYGIAARRARLDVSAVIGAIRQGNLGVRVIDGLSSYSAIRVRQTDVNSLSPERPAHPTLAEFAVEVGLQKNGMLQALYDAGRVQAARLFNSTTRRMGLYMTAEDQAAFHAEFTTLKLLSSALGIETRTLTRQLRDAGIDPYSFRETEFERVYRLKDVRLFQRKVMTSGSK